MLHNGGDSVLENEPPAYIVMPEPHVETAMRILNIKGIRETGPLKDRIDLRIGRQATDDEILTFHTPAYLEEIKAADAKPEPVRIDGGSTVVADGSFESAMAAAGTPLEALHAVVNEPGRPVYTLVRPAITRNRPWVTEIAPITTLPLPSNQPVPRARKGLL